MSCKPPTNPIVYNTSVNFAVNYRFMKHQPAIKRQKTERKSLYDATIICSDGAGVSFKEFFMPKNTTFMINFFKQIQSSRVWEREPLTKDVLDYIDSYQLYPLKGYPDPIILDAKNVSPKNRLAILLSRNEYVSDVRDNHTAAVFLFAFGKIDDSIYSRLRLRQEAGWVIDSFKYACFNGNIYNVLSLDNHILGLGRYDKLKYAVFYGTEEVIRSLAVIATEHAHVRFMVKAAAFSHRYDIVGLLALFLPMETVNDLFLCEYVLQYPSHGLINALIKHFEVHETTHDVRLAIEVYLQSKNSLYKS